MEILKFDPSEQRDIAVDLGVVPEPLAEIECARVYHQNMPERGSLEFRVTRSTSAFIAIGRVEETRTRWL